MPDNPLVRDRPLWCECPDCMAHGRRSTRNRLLLAGAGAVLAGALILPSLF